MTGTSLKLLTAVTEQALEPRIVEDLEKLGVSGYTICNARGKGSRGNRAADWSSTGNIRIEVVCDAATAERIAAFLRDHYYANYAMIIFMSDVTVLRPDKFI